MADKNWGWFGNRSSGEGLEFATPATAWADHAWLRGGQMVQAAEAGGGAVTGTLAFTTESLIFAGSGTETISSTASFATDSITFAGAGLETETGTLAFNTGGITFAGAGVETETGTLAFTTNSLIFAGVGNVTTADADGTLAFTTGSITFAGQGAETETGQIAFTTDSVGFAGAGTETIDGSLAVTLDGIGFSGEGEALGLDEDTIGAGNWYKTKQTKRKLKLVRKLTKEIVHVKEAQKSLEPDSQEYTSYLVHESLLNAKLMEFDEVLQRVIDVAEYQKTLQILNDIKQQMQMREEADMVFIMAIMMEECCG